MKFILLSEIQLNNPPWNFVIISEKLLLLIFIELLEWKNISPPFSTFISLIELNYSFIILFVSASMIAPVLVFILLKWQLNILI